MTCETWMFLPPEAARGVALDLPVRLIRPEGEASLSFEAALPELTGSWCLVLPVEAVTMCAVTLPTQKKRWLRKALPFAVEEWLADEVESFHLAIGERLEDGRHLVFAVPRDWLRACLEACGASAPREVRVDADLLPADAPRLCRLDGRWLLGGNLPYRMALADEDWPALRDALPQTPQACAAPADAPLDGCEIQHEESPHRWLVSHATGCNLAQGEFAVREPAGRWRRWQPAAVALALCLMLQWGFGMLQAWHLRHVGEAHAASSEQLYRQLFPEDRRLVNLRQQFDQHLAQQAGENAGLLAVLGRAGGALAAEGGQVRVQQLDFSLTRGDLALQVQAPGFEALDQLRQRLADAGLAVKLGSASREESGVSARLVIGG